MKVERSWLLIGLFCVGPQVTWLLEVPFFAWEHFGSWWCIHRRGVADHGQIPTHVSCT